MAKNNKKSKQKKSVLNKLGGLSKRSKFIVVVLIFAVLGGGYLTYKSFAATAGPSLIRSEAVNLKFLDDLKNPPYCTSKQVRDPAKNNMIVLQIYCPPGHTWNVSDERTSENYLITWPEGTSKVCLEAKGVGKLRVEGAYHEINSPDYKVYCSYPYNIGGSKTYGYDSGSARNSYNKDSVLITIRSLTRYWYAPGVAPAANGK